MGKALGSGGLPVWDPGLLGLAGPWSAAAATPSEEEGEAAPGATSLAATLAFGKRFRRRGLLFLNPLHKLFPRWLTTTTTVGGPYVKTLQIKKSTKMISKGYQMVVGQ